jgi:hypothetical protein
VGIKVVRKPFHIGSSTAVTLPQDWCQYYADRIKTLTIFGHTVLVIAPEGLETEAQRLIEKAETVQGK